MRPYGNIDWQALKRIGGPGASQPRRDKRELRVAIAKDIFARLKGDPLVDLLNELAIAPHAANVVLGVRVIRGHKNVPRRYRNEELSVGLVQSVRHYHGTI